MIFKRSIDTSSIVASTTSRMGLLDFGILAEAMRNNKTTTTASGQKYSNTTKLTCAKCDIYCVSAKLGSKKVIEIFKYLKYIVLAITFVKIFEIYIFHEVLIY